MLFLKNLFIWFVVNLNILFKKVFLMDSLAITPAVAQSNYERFTQLVLKARANLTKAIEADETRLLF